MFVGRWCHGKFYANTGWRGVGQKVAQNTSPCVWTLLSCFGEGVKQVFNNDFPGVLFQQGSWSLLKSPFWCILYRLQEEQSCDVQVFCNKMVHIIGLFVMLETGNCQIYHRFTLRVP